MQDCPGYFSRVFEMSDLVLTRNGAISKSRFNQIIKQALKNRQALQFTINGNHAMAFGERSSTTRGMSITSITWTTTTEIRIRWEPHVSVRISLIKRMTLWG